MKKLIYILLLLLIPSLLFAQDEHLLYNPCLDSTCKDVIEAIAGFQEARMSIGVVGGGLPPVAGCTSPSINQQQTEYDGNVDDVYGVALKGQSFTPDASKEVYSIIVYQTKADNGAGTLTLRLDDDTDLSAEYMAQKTYNLPPNTTGEIEFIFDAPRPSVVASTKYYFIISNSQGSYALRATMGCRQVGDPDYTGGIRCTGTDWIAVETAGTVYDWYFKVKLCE